MLRGAVLTPKPTQERQPTLPLAAGLRRRPIYCFEIQETNHC